MAENEVKRRLAGAVPCDPIWLFRPRYSSVLCAPSRPGLVSGQTFASLTEERSSAGLAREGAPCLGAPGFCYCGTSLREGLFGVPGSCCCSRGLGEGLLATQIDPPAVICHFSEAGAVFSCFRRPLRHLLYFSSCADVTGDRC